CLCTHMASLGAYRMWIKAGRHSPCGRQYMRNWMQRYSWRSALMGSTRLARRAGMKLANNAAAKRVGIMIAKVERSLAAFHQPDVAKGAPQLKRPKYLRQCRQRSSRSSARVRAG